MARCYTAVVLLVMTLFIGGCKKEAPPVKKVIPPVTLAVFDFRWVGDDQSKYYATGFTIALGERLSHVGNCLTNQLPPVAISQKLAAYEGYGKAGVSDERAIKVGKLLGANYAITGDLELKGNQVSISAHILDVTASSAKPQVLSASGTLEDLPSCQVSLSADIAKALKLNAQFEPNFSSPKTLLLYGKSALAKDPQAAESLRWQVVKGDPSSRFVATRLISFYIYGPPRCNDIANDKRLAAFLEDTARRYPTDTQINSMVALLLIKQYQYEKAQMLMQTVVQSDPRNAFAHTILATIALYRMDSALALKEAKALVDLWPTSAEAHALLGQAYEAEAHGARHGHFFNEMSPAIQQAWRTNSEAAYKEACTAVKLDPDCSQAWKTILDRSRELGYSDYQRKAFEQLIRINPKNMDAYLDYAFCFSPQWGGQIGDMQPILEIVDKKLKPDSAEAAIAKGYIMLNGRGYKDEEILKLADLAMARSKGKALRAIDLKCHVLMNLRRHDDLLETARKGFSIDPNPKLRQRVARGYQFQFSDHGDMAALEKSRELLSVYVNEIPFDPFGHGLLGWSLARQGKGQEARAEFLKALEIDPQDSFALEKIQYVGGLKRK